MYINFRNFLFILLFAACPFLYASSSTYDEILKDCQPEQAVAVQEAFRAICEHEDQKNSIEFIKLQGGMTRASLYTFNLNNKKYVLRFLDPKHPENQRHNEILANKIGYQLHLGPECIFADQNALLIIMPFIEGHTLTSKDFENLPLIPNLGKMLATLHNFGEDYPTRYTLLERLQIHYEKGRKSGIAYPTGFDSSVKAMLNEEITSEKLAPSHGDLNPSNILIGDLEMYIIDWANATWDDPFNDLGYISLLSNMGKENEEKFLESYFGRESSSQDFKSLEKAKLKVYLITAAIWLRYSNNDPSIPYFERVAKLDAELHSNSLKKASEYLREGKVVDLRTASKKEITSYALSFYKAFLENR